MHPNNPFTEDYNFDELCLANASLKKHVFENEYGNTTIPFANKDAVKELNKAILKHQYQLSFWEIPVQNLCPPIPGRLDYLLHVADLLADQKEVHLLDIGTGANLIYPILGTCHFKWNCTASEVANDSIENAQKIIDNNPALSNINLRKQQFKNSILEHIIQPNDFFEVVVCNPPFFKNSMDAAEKNKRKNKNLNLNEKDQLNFGGKSNELWYKGGEEAFIKKMAEESALFKTQVGWFTSLVSQKEHLKNIKRAINKTQPTEVKIVDMQQGNKQSRFVAWRF